MKKTMFLLLCVMLLTMISACNHQHQYQENWSYDDTNHWHASSCNHETFKDKEAHIFVLDAQTNEERCKECGYLKKQSENNLLNYDFLSADALLAKAAFKPFDDSKARKLALKQNDTNDNYLSVSYPFDSIKIINPIKFNLDITEFDDTVEEVKSQCGNIVEVVICDFETYILDELGGLKLSVSDRMIAFRGEKGYMNYLVNSGSRVQVGTEGETWYELYSSHKTLTSESVDKDLTPPFYGILVNEHKDSLFVGFFKNSKEIVPIKEAIQMNKNPLEVKLADIEMLDDAYVYDLYSLNEYVILSLEITVLEIIEKNNHYELSIEKVDNLEKVNIRKDNSSCVTLLEEYLKATAENRTSFKATIEYASPFEGYKPTEVTALRLSIAGFPFAPEETV